MNKSQKKLVIIFLIFIAWLLHVFFCDWRAGSASGYGWLPSGDLFFLEIEGQVFFGLFRDKDFADTAFISLTVGVFIPILLISLASFFHLGEKKIKNQ